MERFELTADLITGIADIDDHHRTLLELANRVVNPSAIKADGPIFGEALNFLAEYVVYHFAAEEYVMTELGYPNEIHHRQWHDRFRDDVAAYVVQAKREGVSKDLRLKISFAVETWLLEHIRITDQGLARFLKKQGGSASVRLPDTRTLKAAGKLPENFNDGVDADRIV
jgi:hemerythrin